MWTYVIRRIFYAIPILFGVNLLTFILFFAVNSPDHMAYTHLGTKYVTQEQVDNWKKTHGYDLPLFYNNAKNNLTDTIFWQKSLRLFAFDFGMADDGKNINQAIKQRYIPSLSIAIPALILGVIVNIIVAISMAFFRSSYLDIGGVVLCVILMSISAMFYIVFGQFLIARIFRWTPISGYEDGLTSFKFIILPVLISVVSGVGSGARWYRSFFLEELNKGYVSTARAKGLSEPIIFFKHILRNGLVPIVTGVVAVLPLLFMGSLLLESFFAIPGLGSYTIDAIRQQDFAIVRAMVFLGTVLYILGLILTDVVCVLVDPRVKFN